jgi:N-acetyl-gamma-glutamyl-phosphate reductase
MGVRVAIVGASGYTGAELVRLVLSHPRLELGAAFANRRAGEPLARVFPQLSGLVDLELQPFDAAVVAERAEVAFTALPHGASARAVSELRERGVAVIDLSADFRLDDADVYAEWYGGGEAHPVPELLEGAVYGLPELFRDQLPNADLIACPGCYPTATALAVAPLLRSGLIEPTGLIVDAKSGASGAGRSPGLGTHLPEVGEGVRAYKIAGTHRHTPEMEQTLSAVAGTEVVLSFTPHLLPMSRGILACVYGRPTNAAADISDYRAALTSAYGKEPFVVVLDDDQLPDTAHVRGSNRAHVAVRLDRRAGTVVALSAIDNLVKGAAGQAIQCLNIARGWPETTGLEAAPPFP